MNSSGLGGDEKCGATKWGKFGISRVTANMVRLHEGAFEDPTLTGILSHFFSKTLVNKGSLKFTWDHGAHSACRSGCEAT